MHASRTRKLSWMNNCGIEQAGERLADSSCVAMWGYNSWLPRSGPRTVSHAQVVVQALYVAKPGACIGTRFGLVHEKESNI